MEELVHWRVSSMVTSCAVTEMAMSQAKLGKAGFKIMLFFFFSEQWDLKFLWNKKRLMAFLRKKIVGMRTSIVGMTDKII